MYHDQNPITVSCRKCEECVSHRKRMLLGKVLAEQQTAKSVWFTTYTYGGGYGNEKAYVLDYRDIQKTFKLMRKAGHRFKYLVCGEYGDQGGRAHWHAIILWETTPPTMPMGERTPETGDGFWHKGIVQHEYPKSKTGAAAYVMKYIDKKTDMRAGIKKSTGLGDKYLLEYAREHARAGLPLFGQKNTYIIKEQKEKARNGKPFFYAIDTNSGIYERMMNAWLSEWSSVRPQQRLNQSKYTSEFLEDYVQEMYGKPIHIQQFVKQHYGWEAWGQNQPRILQSIFGLDEKYTHIKADWGGYYLEVMNHKGEIQWRRALLKRNEGLEEITQLENLPIKILTRAKRLLKKHQPRLDRLRKSNQVSENIALPNTSRPTKTNPT